jgi:hypothetical protein
MCLFGLLLPLSAFDGLKMLIILMIGVFDVLLIGRYFRQGPILLVSVYLKVAMMILRWFIYLFCTVVIVGNTSYAI